MMTAVRRAGTVAAVIGVLLLPGAVRAQGVTVALMPAGQTVAPGDTFNVELDVTQAGSPFNGFDAVIRYDPSALTFLPRSPLSLQEGTAMRGACGNTFHLFNAAADSLSITDVLLCNGVSLPGPGQIYRLHFLASGTPQITHVRIASIQFYNAGLYVNPAFTSDATIGIGTSLSVPAGAPPVGVSLSAGPNPCTAAARLQFAIGDQPLRRLEILDVTGHVVRRWDAAGLAPAARSLRWDLCDERGTRVAPGLYFARLEAGAGAALARIVVIR